MKRILILSLTILLTKIICFSATISTVTNPDSIVSVKVSDIKYANLIFVEHEKLLKDNSLLQQQIQNLTKVNISMNKIDSLRLEQLREYRKLTDNYLDQIEELNSSIKRKNKMLKFWKIGGITISTGLLLFLILK